MLNKKSFPILSLSLLLLAIAGVSSCKNNSSDKEGQSTAKDSAAVTEQKADTTPVAPKAKKVFLSIPSPLQVTALLKQAGTKYVPEILNPPSNASKYTTNFEKSVVLGIYGTDLAYSNIFNQTQKAISFMEAMMKVSQGLGLDGVIAENKFLERFQKNMNNQDSLFTIISDLYRETDLTLKENQQSGSAALILAGGWIEGAYVATNLAKTNKSKELKNRIGELKITLNSILSLLEDYKADNNFKDLMKGLNEIKQVYESVNINYTEKEPTTDEKNNVTTINSSSAVELTDEQLKEITKKVEELRNNIVKR